MKDRHSREFLQAPDRVTGFDRRVLFHVPHQQEPAFVSSRDPAKVAHLPHGNESRFIHDEHAPLRRLLHRLVGQQLLERIRFRRELLAENIDGARGRRAAEHPSARLLDPGDDCFEAGGLAGAGVALQDDNPRG